MCAGDSVQRERSSDHPGLYPLVVEPFFHIDDRVVVVPDGRGSPSALGLVLGPGHPGGKGL
jgi:hypothetical protein